MYIISNFFLENGNNIEICHYNCILQDFLLCLNPDKMWGFIIHYHIIGIVIYLLIQVIVTYVALCGGIQYLFPEGGGLLSQKIILKLVNLLTESYKDTNLWLIETFPSLF